MTFVLPVDLYRTGGYARQSEARCGNRDPILPWRSPDAEIHRLLVQRGALSVPQIVASLHLSRPTVQNALNRMMKHRVVTRTQVGAGQQVRFGLWRAA